MHRRASDDFRQGSKRAHIEPIGSDVRAGEPFKRCISMDVYRAERSQRDMRQQ